MDIETWLGFIFLYIVPIIYQTYKGVEKKRNIFITLILSIIFVSTVWAIFIGFLAYLHFGGEFVFNLSITKWITFPLFIFGSVPIIFFGIFLVSPLIMLSDHYIDKGKIKFDTTHVPNFLKKLFKK